MRGPWRYDLPVVSQQRYSELAIPTSWPGIAFGARRVVVVVKQVLNCRETALRPHVASRSCEHAALTSMPCQLTWHVRGEAMGSDDETEW